MEILIIGNDNPDIVAAIKAVAAIKDVKINVVIGRDQMSYETELKLLDFVLSANMPHEGICIVEKTRQPIFGIRGFIESLEDKRGFLTVDDVINDTKNMDNIFKRIIVPQKTEPYIKYHELESGYTHTFGKILNKKIQEDINKTRKLSFIHNSKVKNTINSKPLFNRKHGVDNRR